MSAKTLHIVVTADGHDWLVRAESPRAALDAWPEGDAIRAERLNGDRARAAYLRELGQADPDA